MPDYEILDLNVADIIPNSQNPRQVFNDESINELSNSILEQGVLNPILVSLSVDGQYVIIAGERRWRASKLAGLKTIPARIIDENEDKLGEIAILENLQRENLDTVDEAKAFKLHLDQFESSIKELASKLGKSESYVHERVKLLDLPGEVLTLLREKKITLSHARELHKLDNDVVKVKMAVTASDENLTVKQLKTLIQKELYVIERDRKQKKEESFLEKFRDHVLERYPNKKVITQHEFDVINHKKLSDFEFNKFDCKKCNDFWLMVTIGKKKPLKICSRKDCYVQSYENYREKVKNSEVKKQLEQEFTKIHDFEEFQDFHWQMILLNYMLDAGIYKDDLCKCISKELDSSMSLSDMVFSLTPEICINALLKFSMESFKEKLLSREDTFSKEVDSLVDLLEEKTGADLKRIYLKLETKGN